MSLFYVDSTATGSNGCLASNNIAIYNGGPSMSFNWNGWTNANNTTNLILSTAQAGIAFRSYTPGSITNDYHPLATASALLGVGANLSSYLTKDKDGASRPASGAWDLGAYVGPSGPQRPNHLRVRPPGGP
jgi:hypothetical protein